jgi:hypothetical protein
LISSTLSPIAPHDTDTDTYIEAIVQRQLLLMPDAGELLAYMRPTRFASAVEEMLYDLFATPPRWNFKTFGQLTSAMKSDDMFVGFINLPAEDILSFPDEQKMRWALLSNNVGAIVIHGHYDPEAKTTVQTILKCYDDNNSVIHILTRDYFDSIWFWLHDDKSLDSVFAPPFDWLGTAWSVALWLICEINQTFNVTNLRDELKYVKSDRFEEVVLITDEPRGLSYQHYATY